MNNEKMNKYTSIFAIIMLLIVTINATYAYFTSKAEINSSLETVELFAVDFGINCS